MKLDHQFKPHGNDYDTLAFKEWSDYIDKTVGPIYINEMFNITKIYYNTCMNLIRYPHAYEFNFINLFNANALSIQLIKSSNKIIDICFSHNVDTIAKYYFRYFYHNRKKISFHKNILISFIKRLTQLKMSQKTLHAYIFMILYCIDNYFSKDREIIFSLINNNISVVNYLVTHGLFCVFNNSHFLCNEIINESIDLIIKHNKIVFVSKLSCTDITDKHLEYMCYFG